MYASFNERCIRSRAGMHWNVIFSKFSLFYIERSCYFIINSIQCLKMIEPMCRYDFIFIFDPRNQYTRVKEFEDSTHSTKLKYWSIWAISLLTHQLQSHNQNYKNHRFQSEITLFDLIKSRIRKEYPYHWQLLTRIVLNPHLLLQIRLA